MLYNDLTKSIIQFLILEMGNPTVKDFQIFLKDCEGVML